MNVANAVPGKSNKPSAIQLARAPVVGILALITILAAFFRFHALATRTFWFDEGVSVGIARLDWYNFVRILWRREANMSLYYLLLRLWLHFGQSEAFVRTLSVLLGLATIPVIYLLGRRLSGPKAGVIAALLLAVNANHVRYSQEARGYSLMVLLCAASSLFFLKCLESPSWRARVAYVLFSAAAAYAHFYSGLLIVAQQLSLLFLDRQSIPREMKKDRRWIALLISPVAVFVATTGAGPLRWIPRPGFKDLWELGLRLSGNDGKFLLAAYAAAVIAAILPGSLGPLRQRVGWGNWRYRLLLLWLLFPILSVFALSFARPLFLQRYFILCLPALLLLAAAGLSRIRSRWLMALAVLVLTGLSVQGTESYYRQDFENVQRDNWRAASQYILANYQPGDALVFHIPMGRMPYEYYRSLQEQSSPGPVVLYPSHGPQIVFLDFVEKPSYSHLAQLIPRYRRVWLVLSYAKNPSGPDETSTALANLMAADRPHPEAHDFTGVDVFLYGGAAK